MQGPYVITDVLPNDRYRVSDIPGLQRTQKFYNGVVAVDQIKRVLSPDEDSDTWFYFKKEKNAVGPSGGSPSTWNLYPKVHSILGPFKINNLEAVVEENITDSSRSFEGMESEEYTNFEILTEEFASGVSSAYSPPLMSSSSDNDSPSTSETVRSAVTKDVQKIC
ncbi:hypothetical protein CVS40_4844 [Lucilia cuprina]|nr:hypothetical protein CVS40_4844 [Lucilia cuprina]